MSGRSWRDRAQCGTNAAYQRHRLTGQPIDDACREAHARDTAERRNLTYAARLGITPEQWAAMTLDERDDALHEARIRPVRAKDPATGRFISPRALDGAA